MEFVLTETDCIIIHFFVERKLKDNLHFLAGRKLEHLPVVSVWSFLPNLVGTPKNIIFNVKVRPGVNPLK